MSLLLFVFLILLLVSGGAGYYGHTDGGWGPWGWSPLGLIVLVFLILLLTGRFQ